MAEKEYIEKSKLISDIECIDICDCTDIDDIFIEVERTIDEQPTADVQEVRHGKWIPTNHPEHKRCSVCDVISFIALYPCINKADYCPHCGAKMDKE